STLQNPSAAYFTPGQYTVKLTVTNASGTNALTRTQYITVYEGPTISFTANNTVGCFPLHVQFTDQSTPGSGNTNVGWQWDFGNGQTSTLQNPSVIYTSAGAFSVTLKVSNDKGCSKVLSIPNYITVTPGVHTSFTNSQAVVCRPPANITFTNTSTGPGVLSYFWDFGDGNSSVLQNPAHIYNTSGSFIVTLVTTSSGGCTDTLRSSVPVVIGGITTSFTGPASICAKAVASFNNTSSPAPGSSNWNFGDGAVSALINPTHVYTAPGTYTISLHNNYANCTDSVSQTIVVNTLPVADFSSPDTIKCEPPLTVNFQDLSSGAVSWQWNFGDGATSTLQNPVHTYNSYGNDTVRLIVTNATGCSDTIVKNNFIKIRKAIISIPSLPARGCIPFTISPVPVINSLDAVTSYLWDFGDGSPTSNLAVPTHTYIAQGTYDVTLIITTSTGCTDTLKINQAVRVGSIPIPDFSASPIPQCALQAVQFTDLSVPADQWLWNFGDGATSTVQNPTHAYGTPGSYNITLTATNNGCPATITKSNYISILPPVARFSFAANCSNRIQFTFTDQSIGPVSWDWDFGDGSPHSFLQNPVHNFPGLGIYSVILTVTNGSCSNSIMQSVHVINENPDFSAGQTVACKAADISITATNITPSNITNYNWNLGIGAPFNTTSNPIHNNFTISGSYSITLITTDINGCKDTVTKPNYIRINGPVANFTATNTSGCAGFTTTFNDLSTTDGINNIVSWQWSFGDGTVQTLSGPPFQHTYGTPGTYSVKLKITDAFGCSDSLLKSNLIVATTPHALFTSPDTLTCPGATVHFQNTSSSVLPVNSTWDFGDASTINTVGTPPVTHSYLATGSYNVKLTIVDQVGCPDSLIKNLYIRVDKPVASFTVSDSVTSCIPLQAQFTNTSQYFTSLLWDFGPGSSTITNPVHYYSSPGSYTVMLIATSPGGCQDTAFKNITVYDTAGSRIDYLPLNGCKPLSINFNAFTPGPVTYLWDFGDGFSQTTTTPNINHVYSSFGDFVPKVILRDPTGCLIPVTGIDTIHIVGATAKFGFDKNLLCDNGPVNFTDSSIFNDPITSYNWTFGDGGTSIQQNPVHQYTASGNYSVTMSIQTQNGCTDTISIINAVKVVQSPSIAITGDTAVCINLPLLHSGTFLVADTSLVIWSWNFPNGNSSALQNPPAQTYTTAGNFIVFVIATNSSGCKDTALQNIVVYPLPTVNMPGTITLQNGFPITIPATYSANTINWVWSPAQGLSCTNCPQPIASPKFNTDYTVTFSDQHGCVNSGLLHVVVICKNANLFMPNTFSPNGDGSNDVFYPRGKGLDRVKSLRIFDRWGEVVFEKNNFPINDPLYGWDGTYKGKNPQAGVYIYQVEVFCDNGDIIKLDGNIALIL
ncbi:MAG TPA: PKD domain-containing protein, partial [Chitinophagaceae bacterium]|nr:PKD domain-containing protein [Chitinophagaceae bacterium]